MFFLSRNVARITASTHFVFPSDIELYPRYLNTCNLVSILTITTSLISPNLIPEFLAMFRRNEKKMPKGQERVFVNSIFEIAANHSLPNTKEELIHLMQSNIVIPFHKNVCPQCHKIPHSKVKTGFD